MINYIRGRIKQFYVNSVVLESYGIGYDIIMTEKDVEELKYKNNKTVIKDDSNKNIIYIYYSHTEDSVKLYGFVENKNKQLFIELLNVGGVGKSTAMRILESFDNRSFYAMVKNKNFEPLKNIKRIGEKLIKKFNEYYMKGK